MGAGGANFNSKVMTSVVKKCNVWPATLHHYNNKWPVMVMPVYRSSFRQSLIGMTEIFYAQHQTCTDNHNPC